MPGEVLWIPTDSGLAPFFYDADGTLVEAAWAAQEGSQLAFIHATPIFEVLYEGERGGCGKTEALLFDFAQHVGKGWGADWRGILFRKTYKQLRDVVAKSLKWFPRVYPGASYNSQDWEWRFPTGEVLLFRYMENVRDYPNYHGHGYPWIGWEELGNWGDDRCFKVMMSCCRSARAGMPRCYRATCNPYGLGHNWIKARWKLPHMAGRVWTDPTTGMQRLAIHGSLSENKVLLYADPHYRDTVAGAARNEAERIAWTGQGGDPWSVTSGGMFDDLWDGRVHVVPPIPMGKIPKGWEVDRSFDWGSSKPFAVLWWAKSNGEPLELAGRTYGKVRGDLYAVAEWYGWDGKNRNMGLRMLATKIADGILERQKDGRAPSGAKPGPADSAIYAEENGNSIARDMQQQGVTWVPVAKGAGSRKHGWEQLRKLLSGALPSKEGPREDPGLFVCSNCEQFIETFPSLPRDEVNNDDVDTDAEDHLADAARYRVYTKPPETLSNPIHIEMAG